jgi:phenylalanyl-tRNA synthetase beta chain
MYAEFNWDLVLKLLSSKIKFQDIPKYPEVRRDLALLVNDTVTFESIYNIANQTEKVFLKEVNLFDVYQGEKLPKGKKSYAVSFVIQDATKTLTDAQIDKTIGKIKQNLETELGASLR